MADRDLGQRILRFLSLRTKPENAVKLAQALRVNKKALNSELYALQKAQKVVKVQESPPLWEIAKGLGDAPFSEHSEAAAVHRGRGKPSPLNNKSEVDDELVEKVLFHLQSCGKSVKSRDIAIGVGLTKAADVNSTLYYLEKKNLVCKHNTKPPSWSLAHGEQNSDDSLEDDIQEVDTSRLGMNTVESETSGQFPSFQETSLFPVGDDDDDSIGNSIVKVESKGSFGFGNGEPKSGSPQKTFKDMFGLNDKNDSESMSEESESSDSFDIRANFIQNYQATNEMDTGITTPAVETDEIGILDVKKEDTESDLDDDIVDVQKADKKADTESDLDDAIVDVKKADIESDMDDAIVDVKKEDEDSNMDDAIIDVSGETGNSGNDAVGVKQEVEERIDYTEGENMSVDKDLPEFDKSLSPDDSKDCLNVLTQLVSLPGLTNFVLKKKTSLPDDRLNAIMEKCLALNYVSGSAKLWKISDFGEILAKAHAGVERKSTDPYESKSVKRKLHSHANGPPPPPMQLLKNQGPNSSFSSSMRATSASSWQANQTRPSSAVSNSSVYSQMTQKTSSSASFSSKQTTQPSLMSLQLGQSSTVKNLTTGVKSSSIGMPLAPRSMPSSMPSLPRQEMSNSGLFDGFMNVEQSPATSPVRPAKQPRIAANIPSLSKKIEEPPKVKITAEYMNYPNQKLTHDILKDIQRPSRKNNVPTTGKSAFHKAPPPSPMDILTKGLKRTDISPPDKKASSRTSLPQSTSSVTNSYPVSMQTGSNLNTAQNQPRPLMTMNQPMSLLQTGLKQSKSVSSGLGQPNSLPASLPRANSSSNVLALSTESFAMLNKSPVSALMEYAQSRHMEAKIEVVNQRGTSHKPMFEMAAFVGNRKFPSIKCHNKKEGRKEAADIAMRQLVAEGQFQQKAKGTAVPKAQPTEKMTHFDTIAALTHRGFTALVSQITGESFAGRKVIAGMVMKRSSTDTGVLISLGTGNRCITGHHLSLQGNTVNDSHAEIIARRGFIRFLYKQLLDYDSLKPSPLFERGTDGKIRIKSNISFHLYISTAPCGDGALFSPRDADAMSTPVDTRVRPQHNPTFSSPVQGLLRTKVEGGEGTIPVEADFVAQTFDGIQRGERLRTMSCTDKICRWNVVGMQGALLSHFLEPVYLDSLTLGLLFDQGHLSRAVCCRVGYGPTDVSELLPEGYKLNHPWLGRVTSCDPPREVQKTKALSINWSFGDTGPEVTDGTKGMCYTSIEKSLFSRCSKKNMYQSFQALCKKFGRRELLEATTYNQAKLEARDFVIAKKAMLAKFKENRLGKWVSKPVEEEMFTYENN